MNARYRTALVTGASSGLGRSLALELARAGGTTLVIAARRKPELEQLARTIETLGARALVMPLDVRDEGAAGAIAALDERLGGLDLVIACAAVGPRLGAPPWSWEAIAEAFHTNFCGAAATLTAALPAMVARRRGHLVGLSSLSSFGALPASAAYCAPKAGLSMLLDCLRLDVAPLGVAVTAVHAGFVDTPMVAHREAAMPQLLSADAAARRIVRALPSKPARIDFPVPLALVTRAAARIPRLLRDPLVRRLGR